MLMTGWCPVIFYGAGVPHRVLTRGARTVDVAPTLAALAGVISCLPGSTVTCALEGPAER